MNDRVTSPIFVRLVITMGLFLVLVVVLLGIMLTEKASQSVDEFRHQQAESHTVVLASASEDALLSRDYPALEKWVHAAIPGESYAYAFISRADGLIMVHSDFAQVGHYLPVSESSGSGDRLAEYKGREVIEIVQPIRIGGRHIGDAHVAYYADASMGMWFDMLGSVLYPLAAALLILTAGVFLIARRITRPVQRLTEVIAHDSIADLKPIPEDVLKGGDEVGELARVFSRTRQALNESYQALDTERNRLVDALSELDQKKTHLEVTLHSMGDAVITTNRFLEVEYLNPAAEQLTGISLAMASGKALEIVYNPVGEDGKPSVRQFRKSVEEGIPVLREEHCRIVNGKGETLYAEHSAAPIRTSDGEITGLIIVAHDVTRERLLQQELNYRATHDELTGLRNRSDFKRVLQDAIDRVKRDGSESALLYLDLDQFKLVNDSCGHSAGDELLRRLAGLLSENTRQGDYLFRLGGDEFTVLLSDCGMEPARRIAETLRGKIEDFHFHWDAYNFNITVSIGVVPITTQSVAFKNLLALADAACYAAKHAGRNAVYLCNQDDEFLQMQSGAVNWVGEIAGKIEKDEFELFFQPILPTSGGVTRPSRIEILLRMRDGDNIVPPNAFLPAAERYNMMPQLDRWVVRNALGWMSRNPRLLAELDVVSINLSGDTLSDKSFADFLEEQFREKSVPPSKVCFEITETVAVSNLIVAGDFMRRFSERGCHFALDDFGSGMSSFAYLKNLPVDYLKIDGAFIKNMVSDSIDYAMVRSISEVGHLMGMKTVAEYVADESILDCLKVIGVDYVQGYFIGMPAPLAQLETRASGNVLIFPEQNQTG